MSEVPEQEFENEGGPAVDAPGVAPSDPVEEARVAALSVETLAETLAKPLIKPAGPTNAEVLALGERLQRLRNLLEAFKSIDMQQVRAVLEQVKELVKIFQELFGSSPTGQSYVLSQPEVRAFFATLTQEEQDLFEAQGLDLESIFRIYDTLMLLLSLLRGLKRE